MTCGAIAAISLVTLYLIFILIFSLRNRRRYWRENRYKRIPQYWNSGWIIEILKHIFGFLNVISPSRLISWIIEKKRSKSAAYVFVDIWVFFSLAGLLYIFINNIYHCINFLIIPAGWVVWLIVFRMADLFQSWFSQFILGGVPNKWQPIDPARSLVLVLMGYFEIVIAYSILAYNYKNSFCGINSLKDAFIYSIGNAITIGSTNITLEGTASYIILFTQLILILIFITAVVQQIVNYSRSRP